MSAGDTGIDCSTRTYLTWRVVHLHSEAEATEALLESLVDDLDIGFAGLVRTYERVVYAVALRVSGIAAEAEELSAESFLRSYVALRSYEPPRILALRPRPWLLTIMLNTWRNNVRTASRRPQLISMADIPEKATAEPSVEEQVERAETRRELADLVARLPNSQRVAVVLRHVVGLPMAEVAVVMHIPEGTAKSHTSRGLHTLRNLCGDRRSVVRFSPVGVGVQPLSPAVGSRSGPCRGADTSSIGSAARIAS